MKKFTLKLALNPTVAPFYHIHKTYGNNKDIIQSFSENNIGPFDISSDGLTWNALKCIKDGIDSGILTLLNKEEWDEMLDHIFKTNKLSEKQQKPIIKKDYNCDDILDDNVHNVKKTIDDMLKSGYYDVVKLVDDLLLTERGGQNRKSILEFIEQKMKQRGS